MKKALMIASVASMIDQFNMRNIALLEQMGYTVEVAANFVCGSNTSKQRVADFQQELSSAGRKYHHVQIPRSIWKIHSILTAWKQVRQLCDENRYDIIHCHSPIGGVIARLAARKLRKQGSKVIYTAHGFHFFRGAPVKNWLLFYPAEKLCARMTDVLITINREDYVLAKQKLKAKKVVCIPGIGLDTQKFTPTGYDTRPLRRELGLGETDRVILSVGELSRRKNHAVILRALAQLPQRNIKYVICGIGPEEEALRRLSESLGVSQQLLLLGYRRDIAQLLNLADIYAFPSLQEGLPVALMEAMAMGKAVICSRIRGNTDLIAHGEGGFLADPADVSAYAEAIAQLLSDDELRRRMGSINREKIRGFDRAVVDAQMDTIYREISEKTDSI